MATEQEILSFRNTVEDIRREIGKEIIGQQDVVEHMIMALVAGGNVLLEGVPGLGKTRLVRTLSHVLDLPFSRIQFTPDLMPADITGTNIIVKTTQGNAFEFQPGPLFASIVLADEINRATPKTQSALLEAMQEHCVTVAGVSRPMKEPYFVLATQNPVEQEGTYPLPDALVMLDTSPPQLAEGLPDDQSAFLKDALLETYGIFNDTAEQAEALMPEAVVVRETTPYGGVRALVRRALAPVGFRLEKPTIEDIILFLAKGEKK